MKQPSPEVLARIAKTLGSQPVSFKAVSGGYTPAARWVVRCASGLRAFVKMGTTPLTANNLRTEIDVYGSLEGVFMPRLLG